MFDTSSNWLMTSLNPDPMMVSAVQVATTLPMFLLTLPAGALTDIIDARRMLIGAQIAVTAISNRLRSDRHDALGDARCAAGDGVSSGRQRRACGAGMAGHHADAGAEEGSRQRHRRSTTRATMSAVRSVRPLPG